MDRQVEGDGNPGNRGVADELSIAEKSSGTMVVGVEEGEGFLLEDEEDGIDEFEVFGEVVHLNKSE